MCQLEFAPLAARHEAGLADFFRRLVTQGDDRFFHPHPLTDEYAARLTNHTGRDFYAVAARPEGVLAYGLLRGWDEGYAIPSLGIALAPEARGTGLAKSFMLYLHQAARWNGAKRVRLRVFPDNVAARRLYESLGYAWEPEVGEQLTGFCELEALAHARG